MESEVPAKQVIDLSRRSFLARLRAGGMALGAAGSAMSPSLLRADDAPDRGGAVVVRDHGPVLLHLVQEPAHRHAALPLHVVLLLPLRGRHGP